VTATAVSNAAVRAARFPIVCRRRRVTATLVVDAIMVALSRAIDGAADDLG